MTYSKLEKYCKENGSYDLAVLHGQVVLTFVPTLSEAVEKSNSAPPKITMFGSLTGDKVQFTNVEIEDAAGHRVRDQKEAELVYREWLSFVEDNY